MAVEHVSVAVQGDFDARQTRAKPIPALAELIWNGLDGDASRVHVEFAHEDIAGGLSRIAIYDDGEGFARRDAGALFGNLGGSKRHTRPILAHMSANGRQPNGNLLKTALCGFPERERRSGQQAF